MKTQHTQSFLALVFALFLASSAQAMQPLTSILSIAAGASHACAVTTAGVVTCWGDNTYGQLGNGVSGNYVSYIPVPVVGLGNGVSALAAGDHHTCALTAVGGVKCWGYNYYGQLGNGVNETYVNSTPVDVVGLSSGVSAIAASADHTCALTTAGGVKCWGYNYFGELGDNTTVDSDTPVDVVGLGSGVNAIAVGGDHACALTTDGGVKCWGSDGWDQLGDNGASGWETNYSSPIPVDVVGLSSGISAIATGGFHTCAVTTTGGVKCWGANSSGQLGDGLGHDGELDSPVPVDVVGLGSGVSAIATSYVHTCAIMISGGVACWGADSFGELGDNSATQQDTPVNVVGLSSSVSAMAAPGGGYYTAALTTAGRVVCWGGCPDAATQRHTPGDVLRSNNVSNDFDGDGKSDALFINGIAGGTEYWSAATKSQAVYPGTYDTSYSYAGTGDFSGDGKTDLLFTKSSNHGTMIWKNAVKTAASYPGTSTAGFTVAAICDVNGDGKDDVVWLNATTGGTQIWSGAVKASTTYPGAQAVGYSVVACADFDGDGKADIFWRNNTTGADEIWLSGNKSTKTYPGAYTDLTWVVVGAGDIDADGKGDVIWYQASTGKTMVWKSGLKSASTYPGANATTFTPKAIGDYDGDGKADLLWGNDTTFGTQIWPGVVKTAVTYPGTYTSGFTIQK